MRAAVPFLALSLAAVIASTGSGAEEPLSLDVMTFNIRTSIGRDGDNSWPHRKELVAETIERFSPHVVGLQEALEDQIEYLTATLPAYRWLGADRGLNGGRGLSEHTPIFYLHEELTPLESGTFWLSSTPDTPPELREFRGQRLRMGRIVTWARFHHRPSDRQIYMFNTHFTLRRGPRQVESASLVAARVAALPADSSVIVTGDFNAIAGDSDTWRTATAQGLRDAWLVATERRGPPLTSSGFRAPPDGWEGRIDWILVGGPIAVRSVETVLHNDQGRYPSDHYPVAARLEIQ
jgi:endonuclease/exonuclease/phosphatase family metal-dependent hydrolase